MSRAPLFLKLVTPAFFAGKIQRLEPADSSVFILSTGRTGTKFLADLTNQLPEVYAVHEPKPSWVLQAWTTAFLEGRVSDDFMQTVLYQKRKKILQDVHSSLYVESNHFIDGFVTHLDSVFKNPQVIHIVRDPRDFITSMINRGNDSGIKLLINKFVPYWAYKPTNKRRSSLTALQREAYHWQAMNQCLSEYGKTHDNYHCYKFEEVFSPDHPEVFADVLTKMGLTSNQISSLDTSRAAKNESRRADMQSWQHWSDEDRREVQAICGELMRHYGYGNEAEWQQSIQ